MDYILLTMIVFTWFALGWHMKTTGDIYRAQADQTDQLIQLVMENREDEVDVISPDEGQLTIVMFAEDEEE